MKGIVNTDRVINLESALKSGSFTHFKDRSVASITQIARASGVAYTTVRNPYSQKKVRGYETAGNGLFIDVIDIIEYFRTARRGRKPSQ